MSTATPHPETRIVLSNISWATYEALVAENDSPGKRIVYDRGTLEIMSPSREHEWCETKQRSSFLPQLTTEVLEGFLARRHESDETTWVRSCHGWVRTLP